MTISITVPNDDHVALRAMAKALEEIAVARGAQGKTISNRIEVKISDSGAHVKIPQNAEDYPDFLQPEVDTTSQQVESLHVSAQHLFKPEDYVSMYNPTTDVYRLAKSSAEIDECVDEGYEQHTREQYEAWKPRPSEVSAGYTPAYDECPPVHDDQQAPPSTDSTGTPWDERIHASSKALNSDGTWRVRRKPKDMDEADWLEYVGTVRDETPSADNCAVQLGNPEDPEAPLAEKWDGLSENIPEPYKATVEPPVAAEGDNFHVDAGEVTEQEVVGIPPLPVPPLPVPPIEEKTAEFGYEYSHMTFPQVMAYLTERHGRISNAQVEQIIASMGLKSIMDLNTQPEHIGPFIARVKALLGE